MYKVLKTEEFEIQLRKLEGNEKVRVEKTLNQIREKGSRVGKPLSGLRFLREKKFEGKRAYFLVYKEFGIVLLTAIGNKKSQREDIDEIVRNLEVYRKIIEDWLKNPP